MRFGPTPVEDLEGAVLGHTLRLPGGSLLKGRILKEDDVLRIRAAGLTSVTTARPASGDLLENEAALRIAGSASGEHVRIGAVATGRANIFADRDGLFQVDVGRLGRLNSTTDSLTLATLRTGTRVREGELVATAKVIPLAVEEATVLTWEVVAGPNGILAVSPFLPKRAGLVLTRLQGTPDASLERAESVLRRRIDHCGSLIVVVSIVDHTAEAVAEALAPMLAASISPVLVLGASQIADRGDVIPRAVALLGGATHRFGIPVDPGNLLLWAEVDGTPVLGVPGCARSPNRSGFDTVLERVLADLPVDGDVLDGLGHGGLLKEVSDRGRPRLERSDPDDPPRVAGLLLAAGSSQRMGTLNKLLQTIDGVPMVRRAAQSLVDAGLDPVLVVSGHDSAAVAGALAELPVRIVQNTSYREGMSTSLVAGLDALAETVAPDGPTIDGALIALADMPWVRSADIEAMVEAFGPLGRESVCVPVFDRKRGNPVLWGASHFSAMRELAGDEGARNLLANVTDAVREVTIGHPGILRDVDTPEALSAARDSGVPSSLDTQRTDRPPRRMTE